MRFSKPFKTIMVIAAMAVFSILGTVYAEEKTSTNPVEIENSASRESVWPMYECYIKNYGVPVEGAKIYKVTLTDPNAKYPKRYWDNNDTLLVFQNIESAELVGTTDANGYFKKTDFLGGDILRLVFVKEGLHTWVKVEEKANYKLPYSEDLKIRFPHNIRIEGLYK